tara:strand:+ start:2217 stop:2360 length:144 start_codon:yes stop_codon:yes gene_type:complete
MTKYYAVVSEKIHIKASSEQEAVKKIEKYYNDLGLYNVNVEILKGGE